MSSAWLLDPRNALLVVLALVAVSYIVLLARAASQIAGAASLRGAAKRRHRLGDVRIHRFLIDGTALAGPSGGFL